MKKIVVVFDLDHTLFNSFNRQKSEWLGSKALWVDLCKALVATGRMHGVNVHFAIATAKNSIDDHVVEAASAFKDYLFAWDSVSNYRIPVVLYPYMYVNFSGELFLSALTANSDRKVTNSKLESSIQIAQTLKAPLLRNIARIYGVEEADYENIFLIDDTEEVLIDAQHAGFSTLASTGVCQDAEMPQVHEKVSALIAKIKDAITEKMAQFNTPRQDFVEIPPTRVRMDAPLMPSFSLSRDLFWCANDHIVRNSRDQHPKIQEEYDRRYGLVKIS